MLGRILSLNIIIYIYTHLIPFFDYLSSSLVCIILVSNLQMRFGMKFGKEDVWNEVWSEIILSVSFLASCVCERERERGWWSGMERGVWNEVWSKIMTSHIFNFLYICFLIYLDKFIYHHFMHGMGLISDQASFLTPTFPCKSNQPQQDKGKPFFPSKWYVYLSDLSSLLLSMSFYVLSSQNILRRYP